MSSKQELLELHQSHLAEAENMRKHVATRQYHATMAVMYYTLYKDTPHIYEVGFE